MFQGKKKKAFVENIQNGKLAFPCPLHKPRM
jgi:hypothetical protein